MIVTELVSRTAGRGVEPAATAEVARLEPKIERIEPGAVGSPAAKLAPLTTDPWLNRGGGRAPTASGENFVRKTLVKPLFTAWNAFAVGKLLAQVLPVTGVDWSDLGSLERVRSTRGGVERSLVTA